MSTLHGSLHDALVQSGIVFDNKSAFRPHMTLARDAAPPEELPSDPHTWECGQITLVGSNNMVNGVSYHVVASH